ncbi:OLC1v1037398C1 [Oldenlandia corymbosa var. corymbosa]|nr:OLC1v1037398C1 [Oldenlandia corymbosa var. corymbosa]
MKKEWFQGKDCLDIGCNSGVITIQIAQKFSCNSILGIDIDGDRVEDAKWTLRKFVRTSKKKSATDKSTAGEEGNQPDNLVTKSQSESSRCDSECSTTSAGRDLFDMVSFEKGNFVRNWSSPANKLYHTIVCLSVTKWIHLNWGDDGLITLFSKVWKLLQPGGVFIVEPQPWTSYSKNRLVSEAATENYQNIEIGPGDFQEILLDKIGFRRVEHINPSLSKGKAGFNRPILAFWK